jgi:guanylate kinase
LRPSHPFPIILNGEPVVPDGILIVLSAPSGAGKTTLGGELLKRMSEIRYSVSVTTRPPRKGEKNGQDYHFISEKEFERKRDSKELIEYARVHGHWYGTPRDFLVANLKRGRDVLLDIDVQGGRQIKKIFPDSVLIFIAPPSISVLESRLRGRHQDDESTIEKRLKAARDEISQAGDYDYLILNEKISRAADHLACIAAERCRMSRGMSVLSTAAQKS